ncbi:hypothetical protein BST40_18055 [Mycobacterium persicum]|nr:hypothetical protein A4G31_03615 [Mycobacterium persicum]ORB46618.1 hypothetical protein BST40_18055 [Mycobacterium persicum]ORB88580.1 hypothetical protein B1T49_04065 [Mycobacterium persicum]ORB93891.1 hypothetical protein B1T44_04390 [Mycobacterium persicum]ORC00624.1 hypothetical protein B1T48_04000 [Mycobacterium persicum]
MGVGNEDTPKPNRQLRAHMERKGVSAQDLADLIAVDAKTVERWLSGETAPYPHNARRAVDVLECDPADLWPDLFPIMTPPSAGTVAVSVYSSRADVPISVWRQLFEGAVEHIDILVYGGTFLFDGLPRFTKILAAATERGVVVRFIIGDPDSAHVAERGEAQGIGTALAARCRMTLLRLQPLSGTSGLEIRTHTTPLYTSMFRADDTLIANPHLYGAPASDNPAIVIKRDDAPDLWNDHRLAFERVWNTARPIQAHS